MKLLTLALGLLATNFKNTNAGNFRFKFKADQDDQANNVNNCSPSIDLVFLLDESGSLSSDEFEQMKDFIEDIAEGLDFSNVQATAASFYHETIIQDGHENFSTSQSDFLTAVNELYYIDSKDIDGINHNNHKDTEIGDALIETKANIFEVANNARPEAQKVIVVLTDGQTWCENRRWKNGELDLGDCTSVADGVLALNPTVEENYVIFAVAIGDGVNSTEIDTLTSNNDDRKFEVGDFSDLSDLIESLEAEICLIPVDCYATENVQYGKCTVESACPDTAGVRTKDVTYTIVNEAENGGASCPTDFSVEEACTFPCPVDCHATSTLENGECSCVTGQKTVNTIWEIVEVAQNGGIECDHEDSSEDVDCDIEELNELCPAIDCVEVENTRQSECECEHGAGTSILYTEYTITTKAKYGGKECTGEDNEVEVDCSDTCNSCNPSIDLVFLLDESGSLSSDEFEQMKDFIEDIAEGLDFSNVQATAASFYHETIIQDGHENFSTSQSDFLTAVNELYYIDSKDIDGINHNNHKDTEIGDALIETKANIFEVANNARPEAQKVIVVLTDGQTWCENRRWKNGELDLGDCTSVADGVLALNPTVEENYVIFAVAIGDGVNSTEIDTLTSNNDDRKFEVGDFSDLSDFIESLEAEICLIPVDCYATENVQYGKCTVESACPDTAGVRTRDVTYTIVNEAENGGASCPTDFSVEEACTFPCPVDCHATSTIENGECSCVTGQKTVDTIWEIVEVAQNGGIECDHEDSSEDVDCDIEELNELCPAIDCVEVENTRQSECKCEHGAGTSILYTEYTITTEAKYGGKECTGEDNEVELDCSETCPQPVDCSEEESTRQDECVCENGVGTYNFFTEYTITPAVNGGLDNCDTENHVEVRDCSETCSQPVDCSEEESTRQDECVCENGVGTYNFFTEYTVTPAVNGGLDNCDTENQVEVRDCSETCLQPVDCSEEESTRQDECACENGVGTYNFFTEYTVTPAVNGGLDNCDTEDQVEVRDCSETCPQPVDCIEVESTRQDECMCDKLTGKGTFKLYTEYTITPAINGGLNNCNTPNKEEEKDCSLECVKCQFQEFFTACDAVCEEGVEGNVTGTSTTFFRDLEGNDASCITVKPANKTESCQVSCTATIIGEDDDDDGGPNTAVIAGAAAAGAALLAAGAVITYFVTKSSAATASSADAIFADPNNTQVFNPLHQETITVTANPLVV